MAVYIPNTVKMDGCRGGGGSVAVEEEGEEEEEGGRE